ncbi:MAG: Unknown protein [uncultured Sulfurovum sp.]|uniref:Uncharacterized protein n=1 Tax=uncultured Sulfurovum sp. TaxID=269237 RepID=A0A6S6TVE8_9BACT|nr:MAG: Unknown protein [uncultured Sulfurovum sp.]
MKNLNLAYFVPYKFLNSLFLGLTVGAIFILYAPLEPSIYSLGGIALALGMLIVAQLYNRILTIDWFYKISLLVEFVLLFIIIYFLIFSYNYTSAFIIYIGYQITFVFGSYLVRAETLFLKSKERLKKVDTAKQLGYLSGMLLSYFFYKILTLYHINSSKEQVYYLHYLLIILQSIIIYLVHKSFSTFNQYNQT